ncbi:MAG: hypothetical protein RI568_13645 [Natronomonas sp.]|nr:hypothetical protein [Natronomonas sp.]MDR9431726.1 hypothetical protein [Natronomonas sp.]
MIMLVARYTGTAPQEVRESWTSREIEEFLICLPGIRRFGHPMFAGGEE